MRRMGSKGKYSSPRAGKYASPHASSSGAAAAAALVLLSPAASVRQGLPTPRAKDDSASVSAPYVSPQWGRMGPPTPAAAAKDKDMDEDDAADADAFNADGFGGFGNDHDDDDDEDEFMSTAPVSSQPTVVVLAS